MAIRPPVSTEVRALIETVASGDEIRREAAIARLVIAGAAAVDRILAAYRTADSLNRVALLRALEGIGDARALDVARDALTEGGAAGIAATGTLRSLLQTEDESASVAALDALVAAALSPTLDRRLRLAALEALGEMPQDVRSRVGDALRYDPDAAIRDRAAGAGAHRALTDAVWADAVAGRLPDDPALLRDGVGDRAAGAPLSAVQKLVDAVRARAEGSRDGPARAAWVALQGSLHQALALRGSRIALYDLRETVGAARGPLPGTFITALHAVGDESCLDAIAAAHDAAGDAADAAVARWRQQLEAAFQAIVTRERIPKRNATVRRVARRAAFGALLSTPSRTRPRQTTPRRT